MKTYSYGISNGIDGAALLKECQLIIGTHWECIHSWTAHDNDEAESRVEIYSSFFHGALIFLENLQ